MVSVTNPLMDSEIWGAILAGKCVVCRSNKVFTPHPTISAVPLPDATLAELNPKTWTVSVNRLFDTQSGILPG
ncbi:hypothetical protein ECZC01_35620 [Escherichia coli]|jgi:hypothetical protein|nr:hypothetical protein [Escherichia coli]RRK72619.1 hypothetical protein DU339_07005 [Escherichia coli]TFL88515.1 hypothetical protein ELY22_20060 [Escherichia coli]TFO22386.1 hypothetical protein ELX86_03535 [Escherichia coli]BDG92256.1 hypothetical protein TUM13867_01680 [Escherichia coli]BDG97054.1 hypothetical protein TUM20902_01680 [Escherichia coli]